MKRISLLAVAALLVVGTKAHAQSRKDTTAKKPAASATAARAGNHTAMSAPAQAKTDDATAKATAGKAMATDAGAKHARKGGRKKKADSTAAKKP